MSLKVYGRTSFYQSLQERLVESPSVLQALSFSGNGYYSATGQGNQGLGMRVSGWMWLR